MYITVRKSLGGPLAFYLFYFYRFLLSISSVYGSVLVILCFSFTCSTRGSRNDETGLGRQRRNGIRSRLCNCRGRREVDG